jgi:hypothetical protein
MNSVHYKFHDRIFAMNKIIMGHTQRFETKGNGLYGEKGKRWTQKHILRNIEFSWNRKEH